MSAQKRWKLTEPAFVAATLLTAGSIITQDDLGFITRGKRKIPVTPPMTAVEVDAKGRPLTRKGADLLASAATGEPVEDDLDEDDDFDPADLPDDTGEEAPVDEVEEDAVDAPPAAPLAKAEAPARRGK